MFVLSYKTLSSTSLTFFGPEAISEQNYNLTLITESYSLRRLTVPTFHMSVLCYDYLNGSGSISSVLFVELQRYKPDCLS